MTFHVDQGNLSLGSAISKAIGMPCAASPLPIGLTISTSYALSLSPYEEKGSQSSPLPPSALLYPYVSAYVSAYKVNLWRIQMVIVHFVEPRATGRDWCMLL